MCQFCKKNIVLFSFPLRMSAIIDLSKDFSIVEMKILKIKDNKKTIHVTKISKLKQEDS